MDKYNANTTYFIDLDRANIGIGWIGNLRSYVSHYSGKVEILTKYTNRKFKVRLTTEYKDEILTMIVESNGTLNFKMNSFSPKYVASSLYVNKHTLIRRLMWTFY